MATLDRRIEALEAGSGLAQEPMVIVVQYVKPGALDAPVSSGKVAGQRLNRRPDEDEEQFIERLKAIALEPAASVPGSTQRLVPTVYLWGGSDPAP